MNFQENIKEWVKTDSEINNINQQLKALRDRRNDLANDIKIYADDNNLNKAVINITGGRLEFKDNIVKPTLTISFIKETLGELFQEKQVKDIMEYIDKKRDTSKTIETNIKRYNKNK
jgi:hypothetical protein